MRIKIISIKIYIPAAVVKFKKFTFLYHAWCTCKVFQSRDIVGLLYLRIPHLKIPPTKDQKKKIQKVPKTKLEFATCQQLFT